MLYKAILLAVLAAVLFPAYRLFWLLGPLRHYYKHHPGNCRVVKRTGTGSEDVQILSSGLAFITTNLIMPQSSPEFKHFSKSNGKGSIQTMDLNVQSSGAHTLPIKHGKDFDPDTFHPHGLSVLEDKVNGEHILYVINHQEGDLVDRVEKFIYSPKTKELDHVKSFQSDKFIVTNDLAVLAEDKFYISNWMYGRSPFISILEYIFQPAVGSILFYNGSDFTPVEESLVGPNGIILSPDKQFIYQSFPVSESMRVYRRDSDHKLHLVQEVHLHTMLDNFHLSASGDSIFGGCHPIGSKALKYFEDPSNSKVKAPSQVLRLPLKNGLVVQEEITEEFYDDGDLISGSSVAGVYKNTMLIGSVIDSLAVCELPKDGQ